MILVPITLLHQNIYQSQRNESKISHYKIQYKILEFLVLNFWTRTRTRTRKFWTRISPDPSPEKNDSIGRSKRFYLYGNWKGRPFEFDFFVFLHPVEVQGNFVNLLT